MGSRLVNIGFGNSVVSRRVIAIISPNAAPVKRLRDEARDEKRLIDATQGRRTRSVLITDSNHVILSSIQSETLAQRFNPEGALNMRELHE
ncbi:MAG: DUF370 domain-containing protein [Deltaproteobacteria bacterium]|nr:DUF370 domain-containing protein [Deltaproteobacteria bacterium]